jgi:hypothetical protein
MSYHLLEGGMGKLTDQDKARIMRFLDEADVDEQRSATLSKGGFLHWLTDVGLGALVVKIATWVWNAIRSFFGF